MSKINIHGCRPIVAGFLAVFFVGAPLSAMALSLGQIDDFEDGTAQGWGTGNGPASNIASGGPAGAGDNFLQYTSSGGSGVNSRMVIFNISQWQGNYIAAGITGLDMDLNNLSAQPLALRLAFFVNPTTGFVTTTPVALPANSGWQHASFALSAGNFTAIGSPGTFASVLSSFSGQLRILSANSPSLMGDVIAATIGIDNIQAIPEPDVIVLVAGGLLAVLSRLRRHRAATRQ